MRKNIRKTLSGKWKTMVLITLTIVSICHLSYQFLVKRCIWWECPPNRNFTVYDLNLPDELFPSDADTHPLHPDRVEGATEEAITTNYWNGGVAIYRVLRLPTEKKASEYFESDLEGYQFDKSLENPQTYLAILDYQSEVADEYAIKCGYSLPNDLRCVLWARYQEYHIFFSGSIGPNEMSNENFISVMKYIDTKMDVLLYSLNP